MNEAHIVGLLSLLTYAVAIAAGIVAARYVNRLVSFLLMLQVYQIGLFIMVLITNGDFRPMLLLPGIMIWAPVSPGGLVPPLIFLLVALLAHRRRRNGNLPPVETA